MEYYFSQKQLDLLEMVRDFVQQELVPIAAEMDRTGSFPMEVYQKAARMGLTCLDLPSEWGGAGVDHFSTALIREELSYGDAGFSSTCGTNGLGFKPVNFAGSDELKKMYADVCIGGGFLAFALTEPNAGSDVANNKTTAIKKHDKYILNGHKCFITNAPVADIISVLAITDPTAGSKGFSMFCVPKGTPGLSIGKREDMIGIRSSMIADVILDNCVIPEKYLIGCEGIGFRLVMETLDKGRVNAGASALGVARAALDHSIKYSQQRITMGEPIWKHQMIQEKLADMGMRLEAARQLVWRAAAACDADAKDSAKLAAMAKCYAADTAVFVANEALQIHGGYGLSRELPVEKLYRDAKIFQIIEGTNEIQRTIIAKNIVAEQTV